MGSALAGVKAGAVASLYFAGSIAAFNALLLLAFESQVLSFLAQDSGCTASPTDCFATIIFPGIPLYDFVRTLVIAILFSIVIGMYFDFLPGPTYFNRTTLVAMIMLLFMLFLGLTGIYADEQQEVLMVAFEVVTTFFYALIMARLYRRFTREVEFQSSIQDAIIIVDRRNLTGKKRTFGVNSKHKIEASTGGKPFKLWRVSGGVQVKEPRELNSSMLVAGDGILKLS